MSRISCLSVMAVVCVAAGDAGAQLLVNPAQTISYNLRVQPIVARQAASEGGATATFFGDAVQQAEIEGYVDTIWAQAGIDVTFLAPTFYESSFAYDGYPADYSSTDRPEEDMTPLFLSGMLHPDPTVLNLFFVEVVPGFSYTSIYSSNGLSYLDRNGVAIFVGSGLLTFTAGLEGIAKVTAHEIGHSLGLPHVDEAENLLQEAGSPNAGHRISAAQIATILNNDPGADGYDLLIAIPEPSATLLGWVGLGGLFSVRRR